jgi:WhiB family transcriptional regulator, redox-sensing transcriptional regulator
VKELDIDWRSQAICRDLHDDTFFPEKSEIAQAKRAQRICNSCPVADQCGAFALAHNERWGIWGGKSTHARRKPPQYLGGGMG